MAQAVDPTTSSIAGVIVGGQDPRPSVQDVSWQFWSGGGGGGGPAASFGANGTLSSQTSPASAPPHLQFTYDTIGQVIPVSIGNCRLPLKPIWVQGQSGQDVTTSAIVGNAIMHLAADAGPSDTSITVDFVPSWVDAALADEQVSISYSDGVTPTTNQITSTASSDTVVNLANPFGLTLSSGTAIQIYTANASGTAAPTITIAYALCHPLDPEELGNIIAIFDGSDQVFSADDGGLVLPPTWSSVQAAQLTNSLLGSLIFPGTEGQEPAALIVADRGPAATPAFRGLRYVILPDYPIVGNGGAMIPRLTIVWRRINVITPPDNNPNNNNVTAVTFAAGAS